MLILLTSGQRLQTLSLLNLENMFSTESKITFTISELLKQSRPNYRNPTVQLKAYPYDSRICVLTHVSEYITRTAGLRQNEKHLFITYKKPHRRATKDTIARWVKAVMSNAGIDMDRFGPHSVRSASTSAAKRGSATVQDILNTAGWTRECTFAKFLR